MSRDAKDITEATNIILSDVIRQSAHSLTGAAGDYDPLMKLIGDAHFVLLGEASHGAHEFYRERAQITKRLIKEKGFNVVAVGVVYLPESEYVSHYFCARLADQYDAVLHFDKTRAVEPLERASEWEAGEAPETFPTAL